MGDERPLWACPACGRTFANRNQTHTCAALGSVDAHFAGCAPTVRATFDAVLAAVRACGPVDVLPERTRIALHVRMSFAALMPRRRWLDGHLVLARRVGSPRFRRIEPYSPRNVLHAFRLTEPAEVDAEFAAHLARPTASARRSTCAATSRAARPTDDRRFRVPVAVDRRLRASTVGPTAAEARERRS